MHLPSRSARLAVAFSLAIAGFPAAASHWEVQGGRSYMDDYATNAAFVEGVFGERPMGNSRFSWSPDASLGWINGRPLAKYDVGSYSTRDDVVLLAAGARFHYGDASNWYHDLFFSFQPALQTGRTQALSTAYEFVSTLGWQWNHVSLQLRHISNGSLHGPNRGETMALVGIGFDF
jgi:hypothetical protein